MFLLRPTVMNFGERGSTKDHPRREEKGGGNIILRNQILAQMMTLSLVNPIVIQILICHRPHMIAPPVMTGGARGRDPGETNIGVARRIGGGKKGARDVIRNQSANQKGHRIVFRGARVEVKVVLKIMMVRLKGWPGSLKTMKEINLLQLMRVKLL